MASASTAAQSVPKLPGMWTQPFVFPEVPVRINYFDPEISSACAQIQSNAAILFRTEKGSFLSLVARRIPAPFQTYMVARLVDSKTYGMIIQSLPSADEKAALHSLLDLTTTAATSPPISRSVDDNRERELATAKWEKENFFHLARWFYRINEGLLWENEALIAQVAHLKAENYEAMARLAKLGERSTMQTRNGETEREKTDKSENEQALTSPKPTFDPEAAPFSPSSLAGRPTEDVRGKSAFLPGAVASDTRMTLKMPQRRHGMSEGARKEMETSWVEAGEWVTQLVSDDDESNESSSVGSSSVVTPGIVISEH